MRALIFPGQGSQSPDMGKALAEKYASARRTFNQISEIIGQDIMRLCGDKKALATDTRAIQMAVFAVSVAALTVLREDKKIEGDVGMGHSLGEAIALHAAGNYDLETATHLVQARGEAMHNAAIDNPGGMFVVSGRTMEYVNGLEEETGAELANINSVVERREQVVFSGSPDEINAIAAHFDPADEKSFRLPIPIPAHHPRRMIPARDDIRTFVEGIKGRLGDLQLPIIPNKTPSIITSGQEAAVQLYEQMTNGVNFAGGVAFMFKELGVNQVVEVGPNNVLTGLVARYVKANKIKATLHAFGDKPDIDLAA